MQPCPDAEMASPCARVCAHSLSRALWVARADTHGQVRVRVCASVCACARAGARARTPIYVSMHVCVRMRLCKGTCACACGCMRE
eukprot:1426048-Pleurochrysis_carterae.AAC.1